MNQNIYTLEEALRHWDARILENSKILRAAIRAHNAKQNEENFITG